MRDSEVVEISRRLRAVEDKLDQLILRTDAVNREDKTIRSLVSLREHLATSLHDVYVEREDDKVATLIGIAQAVGFDTSALFKDKSPDGR